METELNPRQIVQELDRYIIGQEQAKKAVAIALRNRYRRGRLSPSLKDEITPKNILMKGPTGVGKTEIARRLAKIVKAPFIKVEATKYTEVGYVGRDVESMIRDLVEVSIRLVKEERYKDVYPKANEAAKKKIEDILFAEFKKTAGEKPEPLLREEIKKEIENGKFDKKIIEVEVIQAPKSIQVAPGAGNEINIGDIFGGMMPRNRKKRKITVKEALNIFLQEESDKLVDGDSINSEALSRAEQDGIIFIDEIDKIAGGGHGGGPDVSREGVQRDILPIVEGSTVSTKYGLIKTDYILFIAAGAFHVSKMEDLIPELQGRFPIRVELVSLTEDDFIKILTQPDNAILRQYTELLKVDKIALKFTDDAIKEVARLAAFENENSENLGARRLHTVMEQLLTDISFNADGNSYEEIEIVIDREYIKENTKKVIKEINLKKYIL
ncbi:MAG: ATP-dependent protease ATPase subunit HslU [Clostridiales bacterium]|jgi:ATP-dependent HslUV protease ATP-binding subunit HslU|nr:ATP-dependent protease ATPase subunit HslU [Clostridiales bacterium]